MAKGPCGEDFKTAFSCFVFSEAEPKGSDCVDAFRAMQSCFQDFPEYYSDQLKEDESDDIKSDKKESGTAASMAESPASNANEKVGDKTDTAEVLEEVQLAAVI